MREKLLHRHVLNPAAPRRDRITNLLGDVYLALTRKETSIFESPGGLECAHVERAYSKVLAEVQRILVEAHHRPRGSLINGDGLAKPLVRPPAPSPQQPTKSPFQALSATPTGLSLETPGH